MQQDIASAFAELGLRPGASESEVKAAWRRLVSQWHPDRNDSAAAVAKMQRINRAAEAIRSAGVQPSGSTSGAAQGDDAREPPAGTRPTGAQQEAEPPARTVARKVRLTLEEAAAGCTKVLRGQIQARCAACAGAGVRGLAMQCPGCLGSGAVRQRAWFGWAGSSVECDACQGSGRARQACAACAGTGKAAAHRYQVTVRFPPGVRDGDLLGVSGRRGVGSAPPTDLNLRIEVPDHALFDVASDGTVTCSVPVDGFAWIASRCIEVPTLCGLQTLPLQHEQLHYRLKGMGFPVERGGPRGDHCVDIAPVFADHLSTDQQILLDQLIATTSGPGAKHRAERLSAWQQAVSAWQRNARRRT